MFWNTTLAGTNSFYVCTASTSLTGTAMDSDFTSGTAAAPTVSTVTISSTMCYQGFQSWISMS